MAVFLYGLSLMGLKRALGELRAHADWYECAPWRYVQSLQANPADRRQRFGWPFDDLAAPALPLRWLPLRHGLLISACAAWWAYVVIAKVQLGTLIPFANLHLGGDFRSQPQLLEDARLMSYFLLSIPAAGALCNLVPAMLPWQYPLSFWGRIRTGRWIIPGYDRIVLSPFLTWLVIGFGLGMLQLSFAPTLVGPLTTGLAMAALLCVGPPLAAWKLTAPSRLGVDTVYRNRREFMNI